MNRSASGFSMWSTLAIGTGFMGISAVNQTYDLFMPQLLNPLLEDLLGSKEGVGTLRGLIMGIDNAMSILIIPIVGLWSDRIRSPLGKRLPFLAVGMPLAALLFFLLPMMRSNLWTLLGLDMLFLLAMTLFRAPVVALMPDQTAPQHRSRANGIINFMGGLGTIAAVAGFSKLFDVNPEWPFLSAAGVLLAAFIYLFFQVDRNPPYSNSLEEESDDLKAAKTSRNIVSIFVHELAWKQRLVLFAIFFFFVGYSGVQAHFTSYATEYLGLRPGEGGAKLTSFSLAFLLAAIPSGLLAARIGMNRTMRWGVFLFALVFIVAPLTKDFSILIPLLALGGIGWALIIVQAYPTVVELASGDKIGRMTGLYYFFSMFAAAVGPFLVGILIDLGGYRLLFWGGAVFVMIAFFLLQRAKKMT